MVTLLVHMKKGFIAGRGQQHKTNKHELRGDFRRFSRAGGLARRLTQDVPVFGVSLSFCQVAHRGATVLRKAAKEFVYVL